MWIIFRKPEYPESSFQTPSFHNNVVQPDIFQRFLDRSTISGQVQLSSWAFLEPNIESTEVSGSERIPFHRVMIALLQPPFVVPCINLHKVLYPAPLKNCTSRPVALPTTSTIFGPAPDNPDAVTEIASCVRPEGIQYVRAVSNFNTFDWIVSKEAQLECGFA